MKYTLFITCIFFAVAAVKCTLVDDSFLSDLEVEDLQVNGSDSEPEQDLDTAFILEKSMVDLPDDIDSILNDLLSDEEPMHYTTIDVDEDNVDWREAAESFDLDQLFDQ